MNKYNFNGDLTPFGMPLWDVAKQPFPEEFPEYHTPTAGILLQCEAVMLLEHAREKKLIVDIGTFWGLSASIMSLVAEQVITIDVYMKFNGLTYEQVQRGGLSKFKNITAIESDADEVARTFSKPVDLIFIDANHEYKNVKGNFDSWFPKVTVGGEILFHDYQVYFRDEVMKFINDEVITRKDLEVIDKVGTIIAFRKLGNK